MAAYRRVYGFGHLRADCRGPGSAPEPCARFEDGTTYAISQMIIIWQLSHLYCTPLLSKWNDYTKCFIVSTEKKYILHSWAVQHNGATALQSGTWEWREKTGGFIERSDACEWEWWREYAAVGATGCRNWRRCVEMDVDGTGQPAPDSPSDIYRTGVRRVRGGV